MCETETAKAPIKAEGNLDAPASGLRPLSPVLLDDAGMEPYEEEFKFAFGDDRIKNIALSGPYGAGKNTVMETWESRHPELNFLHIELAHFEEPNGHDEADVVGRDLEAEILNQLIHKTDASKTPKSRFKRTADRDCRADSIAAAAIVAFVALTAALAWILNAYSFAEFLALPPAQIVTYGIAGVAWLALAWHGTKHLLETSLLSKTMKKLKFVNAELEVADRGDDSAFNRSMDDLLYLINGSGSDAIVFEDLDRFGRIDIFEKLRSINSLANQNRLQGKTLKFVYLIHDGLFASSHDRTKFFDYIIPVIPYVDTSNSFDILKTGLRGVGIAVDDHFARGLSVFIDDPRILNAIVDETFHYSRALESGVQTQSAEDCKRLVGVIAYKETFPQDFESLQFGRGYLYTLLSSRARLQGEELDRLDEEIRSIEAEIDEIQKQMMYDEDELALLYLNYRVGELARAKGPYQTFNLAPYKTPRELLTKIEGDTDLTAYFNSMKQSLEGNPEYQKRLSTSKQGRKKEIGRLRASISKLEKERADLSRKPLRELFSRESHFDLIPDDLARPADYAELRFDQVKGSPYFGLVPYLIKSGAVDETYGRYASNFYPLSLTARDRDFVTTALQGIAATDPNREIDSPRTVLVHLDDASLGRKQARNYALFKALLEDDCRHELDVLLKGLEADEDLGFLVGYTASRCYTDRLFPYLKQSGSPVVSDVLYTYESLGDERMRSFCHRLASDGGAFLQDEEVARGLRETASADPAFLAPGPAEPGKVAKGLESVGYRPQQIDFDNIDPVLAAEAYQKRLFEPNATNVSGFLSHFGTAEELVSPDRLSNTICEASVLPELEMLKHYVEDNAGLYVSSLTADIEIPINADESTVAWLLNAESLDADSAEPFVAALRGKPVKHLSTIIRREMKSTLMSHGKTAPSANNILDYYSSAGEEFDETLVRFIEDNDPPETLNSALADELIGQDNRFLEDLIKSNVSTKKVVAITGSYGRTFEEFGITGLPEERMNALINIGAIDMTNANLSFIRIYYEDSSPLFASSSIEGYCALVTGKEGTEAQANFNENEVLGIFALPQIDVGFKLYLLDEFDSDIALDESYPEELLAAICKSNLSDADLPNLPMFYESGGKGLKQAIAEAASSRHQQLMNAGVNMQWGMVEHILRCMKNSVDRAGTVELMAWRLGRDDANPPSRSMLRQCFASSGLEPYVKLLDSTGGAVQIPYTSYDKALLEELAELNMCSDKIVGPNEKGFIEAHPKGYTRKKAAR